MTTEMISLVACISSALSATAALTAALIAWKTVSMTLASKRADTHTIMQGRIREIQRKFSSDVNSPDTWNPTIEEKRLIRLYWYAVFDEWIVCCQENKAMKKLWNQYYRSGTKSALKNRHFLEDLKHMFDGESTLNGLRNEFKDEINSIYAEITDGRNLIWS